MQQLFDLYWAKVSSTNSLILFDSSVKKSQLRTTTNGQNHFEALTNYKPVAISCSTVRYCLNSVVSNNLFFIIINNNTHNFFSGILVYSLGQVEVHSWYLLLFIPVLLQFFSSTEGGAKEETNCWSAPEEFSTKNKNTVQGIVSSYTNTTTQSRGTNLLVDLLHFIGAKLQ